MPVALSQVVAVGRTQLDQKRSLIEMHDDGRFVISRIDAKTGERGDVIMDAPASSVRLERDGSALIVGAAGSRRRIDFTPGTGAALLAGGVIGAAINSAVRGTEGKDEWLAAFAAHGVTPNWWNRTRVVSLSFLGVLVVVAVVLLATGVIR